MAPEKQTNSVRVDEMEEEKKKKERKRKRSRAKKVLCEKVPGQATKVPHFISGQQGALCLRQG